MSRLDYGRLHIVFGAVAEKDHEAMIDALPAADSVVTCEPPPYCAADAAGLEATFANRTGATVGSTDEVGTALARARQSADPGDCPLVTGSLYVVGDVRSQLTCRVVPKSPPSRGDDTHPADSVGNPAFETVETRLSVADAAVVAEVAAAVGLSCETAATDSTTYAEVTLAGTHSAFEELVERLGARSSGFEYLDVGDAVERAREVVAAGADVVDVGGEATNPDVDATATEVEIDCVVPVIEAVADLDAAVSVDTRKAAVAEAALSAGADIVNDVSGFEDPALPRVAAEHDAPVVAMHSGSVPLDRSEQLAYDDVVADVIAELDEIVRRAVRAGVDPERVVVDPGVGFGKSATESFEIVNCLHEFTAFDGPLMLGHSRKSMFDHAGSYPDEGAYATVATSALAVERGVDLLRVHDVEENAIAVRTARASLE